MDNTHQIYQTEVNGPCGTGGTDPTYYYWVVYCEGEVIGFSARLPSRMEAEKSLKKWCWVNGIESKGNTP